MTRIYFEIVQNAAHNWNGITNLSLIIALRVRVINYKYIDELIRVISSTTKSQLIEADHISLIFLSFYN